MFTAFGVTFTAFGLTFTVFGLTLNVFGLTLIVVDPEEVPAERCQVPRQLGKELTPEVRAPEQRLRAEIGLTLVLPRAVPELA